MRAGGYRLGVSTTSALPLRRLRTPFEVPAVVADVAVAAAVAGVTIVMLRGRFAMTRPSTIRFDTLGVIAAITTSVPLVAWRQQPFRAFVASTTASALMAAIGHPIGLALAPAVALYFVAGGRTVALPWTRAMTAAVLASLCAYLVAAGITESVFPASELFHSGLLWSVAWFAGERTRLRREQIAELRRDAQRERLLAAAEERARIARDLHDSVGHAINVIGVRAGAARMRHAVDPDRSLQALEAIEDLARRTVAEIDHFVGALRAGALDHDGVDSPLGIVSVPSLISQHKTSGLDVTYIQTGLLQQLPPVIDQAVYRIIQEALTNASRHGNGSAQLTVDFADSMLTLTISNPVRPTDIAMFRVGHGLIGMNERARLVGGTLDIDHRPGEYVVRACLPVDSPR